MEKKILIVGATSGLGLRLVEIFAGKGYMVGAAGRHLGKLDEVASRYPEGRILTAAIDVTADDAPEQMDRLIDRMGGLDCYCHVAGVGFDNPDLDPRLEAAVMDTNATGLARMCSAAFRWFRDKNGGKGHIAAITSVAGTNGIGRLAAYSASKAAQQTYLRALCQLARMEKLRIGITDIRPGWVRTSLLGSDERYPMEMTPEYAARLIAGGIESGRRVVTVDLRWRLLVALWRMVPDWLWVRLPVEVSPLRRKTPDGSNSR